MYMRGEIHITHSLKIHIFIYSFLTLWVSKAVLMEESCFLFNLKSF